jgi:hypothetical protein
VTPDSVYHIEIKFNKDLKNISKVEINSVNKTNIYNGTQQVGEQTQKFEKLIAQKILIMNQYEVFFIRLINSIEWIRAV